MKNYVLLLLLFGGLFLIPCVNAYPPNPKNCCVYCPNDNQKLCFWNDNNFLYMSIEPDGTGSFCADVIVNQNDSDYNVKGYSDLDEFICREIEDNLEMRLADGTHERGSPFNPTRPLTINIENCDNYLDSRVLKYPTRCGAASTTSSTIAKTSTTTMKLTTTSSLPTTTVPTTAPTSTTTSLPTTTTTILPKQYSISGFITGAVIAEVSVKLTGKVSETIFTNEVGYFKFSGLEKGYYTITPQCEESDFEPQNYLIQNLASDLVNMDFISTVPKAPDCPPTAICGDDQEEIELLKYLRDNVLRNTTEGRELIEQWKKIQKKKKREENDENSISDN
jgi:hypothetical protein